MKKYEVPNIGIYSIASDVVLASNEIDAYFDLDWIEGGNG